MPNVLNGRIFGLLLALAAIQATRNVAAAFRIETLSDSIVVYAGFVALHVASGLPYLLIVLYADRATRGLRPAVRIGVLAAAVIVGASAYAAIYAMTFETVPHHALGRPIDIWGTSDAALAHFGTFWVRGLLFGGMLAGLLYLVVRERSAAEAIHRLQMERVDLERQMTEARLQILQAQIEPHFLFNTLASIKTLYATDPGAGRALLRNLAMYLRAALPLLRTPRGSLRQELELTRAYLDILRVRMGTRLRYEISVPSAVLEAELPPMMLLTLVENAIKHGVGPLPEGGVVSIEGGARGAQLELRVVDNGAGLRGDMGTGIGIANIRARLKGLYGVQGRLDLHPNADRGVTAHLLLPCRLPAGAAAPVEA